MPFAIFKWKLTMTLETKLDNRAIALRFYSRARSFINR